MIDDKKINRIIRDVLNKFPEFKGIEPKITEKVVPPQHGVYKKLSLGVPKVFRKFFSLQFKRVVKTADAVKLERILIVTLDEQGEIIKISQTR